MEAGPVARLEMMTAAQDRVNPVIRAPLGEAARARVVETGVRRWELRRTGQGVSGERVAAEIETEGSEAVLTAVLPGEWRAGETRQYELWGMDGVAETPWNWVQGPDRTVELKNREKTVFRYHPARTKHPNYGPIYDRAAYLHPVFTPDGHLVTGDFSRAHPHHRGIFLAYTKTKSGKDKADFWNLHGGSGRIDCMRVGEAVRGPVVARVSAEHEWKVLPSERVVLRERWDIRAYDIPGSPYWLFDIVSTQQAVGEPLEILPHRYGGMAYRGPDSFLPPAVLDVRTSAGLDRKTGDQKQARWVDMTGPLGDDGTRYGGVLIADHPENLGYPTIARIHPTSLPFFSYVSAHTTGQVLSLPVDRPTVFRYRVLVHDGHPVPTLDERIWRDFAEPCAVKVEIKVERE